MNRDTWLLHGITWFCLSTHELKAAEKLHSASPWQGLQHITVESQFSVRGPFGPCSYVVLQLCVWVLQNHYEKLPDVCCNFLALYLLRLPITKLKLFWLLIMWFSVDKLGCSKSWGTSEVLVSDYIQVPGSVVLLSNNILPVARLTKISPFML